MQEITRSITFGVECNIHSDPCQKGARCCPQEFFIKLRLVLPLSVKKEDYSRYVGVLDLCEENAKLNEIVKNLDSMRDKETLCQNSQESIDKGLTRHEIRWYVVD
jgi:hypothetical protein